MSDLGHPPRQGWAPPQSEQNLTWSRNWGCLRAIDYQNPLDFADDIGTGDGYFFIFRIIHNQ